MLKFVFDPGNDITKWCAIIDGVAFELSTQHSWLGKDGEKHIDDWGFFLPVRGDLAYQLITPHSFGMDSKVSVILVKHIKDRVVLLGKVSTPLNRVGAWAATLIERDVGSVKPMTLPSTSDMFTPESMAANVLAQIEEVAKNGLNKVYTSHDDYLYDMFADLPWDDNERRASIKWLLTEGRERLDAASKTIIERGGPDYVDMFKHAHLDGMDHDDIVAADDRWHTRL